MCDIHHTGDIARRIKETKIIERRNANKLLTTILPLLWLSLVSGVVHLTFSGVRAQAQPQYKILDVSDKNVNSNFDPFGGYLIIGQKPREFTDFSNITIEAVERNDQNGSLRVVGAVNSTNESRTGATLQFEEIDLTTKTLRFKTETVADVSYQFDGRFLKTGDLTKFYRSPKVAVLTGVLTKFAAGAKAAAKNVRFRFTVWKARYYAPRNE